MKIKTFSEAILLRGDKDFSLGSQLWFRAASDNEEREAASWRCWWSCNFSLFNSLACTLDYLIWICIFSPFDSFFFFFFTYFPSSSSCRVEASRQVIFKITFLYNLFFTIYFQANPTLGVTEVAGILKTAALCILWSYSGGCHVTSEKKKRFLNSMTKAQTCLMQMEVMKGGLRFCPCVPLLTVTIMLLA